MPRKPDFHLIDQFLTTLHQLKDGESFAISSTTPTLSNTLRDQFYRYLKAQGITHYFKITRLTPVKLCVMRREEHSFISTLPPAAKKLDELVYEIIELGWVEAEAALRAALDAGTLDEAEFLTALDLYESKAGSRAEQNKAWLDLKEAKPEPEPKLADPFEAFGN